MLKRRTQESAKESNVEFENLTEGEHEARLVYVADLGLQAREFKGEVKPPAQQISLGLEIVGETVTIDGEEHPRLLFTQPFNIFQSLTEKGKELEYYRIFNSSAQPDGDADWEAALGLPCNVVIKHIKGKGANEGKVFDNISHLTPIPKKYQDGVEAATIEPCIGDADDDGNEATKALYGLAKFVFDKRISEEQEQPKAQQKRSAPAQQEEDEDAPW